ncbi:MAG: hypothetical protein HXL06_001310 [Candidatus Nanosynbacter sp. HMT-348_TM7c-JB]|nr:MAG: hypothetical protein HXL06_001310 [Candidatus Nanosynbacter sp. HMT-348_TM7c-JB]
MASDEFYEWLMEDLDDWKRLIDQTSDGIDKMERDNWEWKQARRAPLPNQTPITYIADGLATL